MKKVTLISIILGCLMIFSCSKDEPTPLDLTTLDTNVDTTSTPMDVGTLMGTFKGSAHPTSGGVTIEDNVLKMHSDFKSDSGPDLYIYLAQELNGNGFIDLGLMQSTTGEQSYNIPAGVDYTKNKYVLVWCKQYSVLFGYAEVK
ncbi:DM13 domain-containing protein [Flammeovirga sp. EKP202]|uniref:DM13 domain-containing protein n=1 Tax=Flammeovirga sp. EKP202 TaxID=2770592 RepID=UPI00165FEA21|nr:DM13 domain-containing protein [Flammeovirga sp. EKP202]MBD0403813.1 DM13 domain-containing protein [Flammeovirga sp. EKP202]